MMAGLTENLLRGEFSLIPKKGEVSVVTYADQSVSLRTSNSTTTDATSFATASVTPTANRMIYAVITSAVTSGTPNQPTCSGNGLTWHVVHSEQYLTRRITVFRAFGASPSAGAITFDFSAQSQASACWSVFEITGNDTADPIVQAKGFQSAAQGTTWNSNLDDALSNVKNLHICVVAVATNAAITHDSDFAELSEGPGVATAALNMNVQWAANQQNNTSTITNVAVLSVSFETRAAEV